MLLLLLLLVVVVSMMMMMMMMMMVVVVMMMWESKAQTLHWCVSRNTVVRKQNLAWISFKRKKKKKSIKHGGADDD